MSCMCLLPKVAPQVLVGCFNSVTRSAEEKEVVIVLKEFHIHREDLLDVGHRSS